ncbi:MAG: carboxypeptidase regulatory-like domain-containing protein [bacterium]|nr:carboxypeptidase regulatory-like domain-containing protein [bacterium]
MDSIETPRQSGRAMRMQALRRRLARGLATLLLLAAMSTQATCAGLLQQDDDGDEQTNLFLLSALLIIASNPCNSTASPTMASALHSSTVLSGRATIFGRVATLTGAPVVAAVVIATSSATNHFSTLSSVNRDGTFYLSGLPTGATYKVAIESINSDFQGRIATHVDCFQTPSSFTDGFYAGSGVSLVSTSGAGTDVVLSTANELRDLGTILLNQ